MEPIVLVPINDVLGRCRGKFRRSRRFGLVQHSSPAEHVRCPPSTCPAWSPCDDIGLKLHNQLQDIRRSPQSVQSRGCLHCPSGRNRVTVASASSFPGGGMWRAAPAKVVNISRGELSRYRSRSGCEWRRSTLCDSTRGPSRLLIVGEDLGWARLTGFFLHESHHVSWSGISVSSVRRNPLHENRFPPVNDRSRCRCETMVRQ